MHENFIPLALDHPDWTIPWAGIGAVLLGTGSFLSGLASLILARRKEQVAAAQTQVKADVSEQAAEGVAADGVGT